MRGHTRIVVLVLATAAAMVVVPVAPLPASARVPATVQRIESIAEPAAMHAAGHGAAFERSAWRLPVRANMIAVSFRSAGGDVESVDVETKFHTDQGWTDWQHVRVDRDDAPDGAEARKASDRTFTAPLWVGTADEMALRLVVPAGGPAVSDVKVHLINTKGDAAKPTVFGRVASVFGGMFRGHPAAAMTTAPGIISRAGWGADESLRECCPRYAPSVQVAFVHHTAGTNSYSPSDSPAIVRGIYSYHTQTRGYADIAYNFLIDRYGQIFEGRAGGTTMPVIGAHTLGFNTGSTGISLMGTFDTVAPPPAMISALENLLAWKMDVHHIPPIGTVWMINATGGDRYPAGQSVQFNRISGHRDANNTGCPGAKTYALLPQIRSVVNGIGLPKLYLPTTSPVVRPDGDGVNETATLRASFTTTVNWTLDIQDAEGIGTLRRLTGQGSSLSAVWDGRVATGELAHSGPVRYVMQGIDGSGRPVMPATGSLFVVTDHPDGTVLKSATKTVLLEDGRARPMANGLVHDSWFRPEEDVPATDTEIGRYPAGAPLAPREGTLLVSTTGEHAIFSGGARRPFSSEAVFTALGYSAGAALPMSDAEAAAMTTGPAVSATDVHPSGTLVKAPDGSYWVVSAGQRLKVPTDTIRRSWYRDVEVVNATANDLVAPQGNPMTYREGVLFVLPDASYWIYSHGLRRGFDPGLLDAMGYRASAALALPAAEAAAIPSAMIGHYPPPGRPVPGDWNGNGTKTPGAVRGNMWYINNGFTGVTTAVSTFGRSTDVAISGDWDRNGTDTPGVVRGNAWYLDNSFNGVTDVGFSFGRSTDRFVVGDWNGDGRDTPGVVRGNTWYLSDSFDGHVDRVFSFGRPTDTPVVGDWNGDGKDTPGVVRGNTWYLNDGFDGTAEHTMSLGRPTDTFVTGDWDGNGTDTPGVVRAWTWYLSNTLTGSVDLTYIDKV